MGQAIGIDFGTTNTVVSYIDKNKRLQSLKYKGKEIIPSVLFFKSKDEYIIGDRAKKMKVTNPRAAADNFKSRLGNKSTPYDIVAANGDQLTLHPRKAIYYFLNMMFHQAVEEKLIKEFGARDGVIDRVVITVPAKFNDKEIEQIRNAAVKAMNLDKSQVKLVPEPTAAAVAAQYNEDNGSSPSTILIYDFGGGTFDVSVLKKENHKHTQIETNGDKELGGNDLTNLIVAELLERINDEYGKEFPLDEAEFDADYHGLSEENYKVNMDKLREAAEQVKIDLSDSEETDAPINIYLSDDESVPYVTAVSRKDFEVWIKEPIEKTAEITERVLHDPKVEALGEINRIVLAGGSSQIPMIRKVLEKKLHRRVERSNDVSTLISRGAAILAQDINSIDDMTEQVTNMQIGVAATEGMILNKFQVIIPEDTKLPCTGKRDFSLARDGQQKLNIAYYEYDIKNFPKAKIISDGGIQEVEVLHIDNLPPNLKKDDTIVTVTFNAKADGSIDIEAEIKDRDGNKIGGDKLSVTKGSDLI